MKKKRPVFGDSPQKHYPGMFDPDAPDVALSEDIVSATEMTGAIPAARQEPADDDRIDDYYF